LYLFHGLFSIKGLRDRAKKRTGFASFRKRRDPEEQKNLASRRDTSQGAIYSFTAEKRISFPLHFSIIFFLKEKARLPGLS
jgi:hypothetical protein